MSFTKYAPDNQNPYFEEDDVNGTFYEAKEVDHFLRRIALTIKGQVSGVGPDEMEYTIVELKGIVRKQEARITELQERLQKAYNKIADMEIGIKSSLEDTGE